MWECDVKILFLRSVPEEGGFSSAYPIYSAIEPAFRMIICHPVQEHRPNLLGPFLVIYHMYKKVHLSEPHSCNYLLIEHNASCTVEHSLGTAAIYQKARHHLSVRVDSVTRIFKKKGQYSPRQR